LSLQEKNSINGMATEFLHNIASYMAHNRLQELLDQPVPPFQEGTISHDLFMEMITAETWQGQIIVRENEFEQGFKALAREMERINRFGFTASEYELAKLNYFSLLENAFNQQNNNYYAQEYTEYFLEGGYIPGIRMEYEILKQISAQIPLEMVNEYIQDLMGEKNMAITLIAPQKEGVKIPGKNELLTWFAEVKKEELTAYQVKESNKPLLEKLPSGGKIRCETTDERFNTTVLTLNNGIKVVIKPNSLNKDEILMAATSPGGTSHFPETNPINMALYQEVANLGGVGEFSNRELTTLLAGKNVKVAPVIDITTEGFRGSSNNRDFETMLQLIYLHFTAPRVDNNAFESFINRTKSMLENEKEIITLIGDSLKRTVYVNKKRHHLVTVNDLNEADYQTIMQWRKDRYSDAGDFTFVFTGSIDTEETKDLIARYLGSLPSTGRNETHMEITDGYHTGHIQKVFNKKMETPQAIVVQIYSTILEMTLDNEIKTEILAQILDILFKEKIREERSDVYSISVNAHLQEYPTGLLQFQVNYFTEPGKEASINEEIKKIIRQISDKGPQEMDLHKAKEFMRMNQQNKVQENEYWIEIITDYYAKGVDRNTNYVNILNQISTSDVKEIAKTVLESVNLIEVIMKGE